MAKALNRIITLSLSLFLFSCNEEQARIELLEKELNIALPEPYEQIENVTEGFVDFEVRIVLKFADPEFETLTERITSSELPWENDSTGYRLDNWANPHEPVHAELDSLNSTLKFSFVHL